MGHIAHLRTTFVHDKLNKGKKDIIFSLKTEWS